MFARSTADGSQWQQTPSRCFRPDGLDCTGRCWRVLLKKKKLKTLKIRSRGIIRKPCADAQRCSSIAAMGSREQSRGNLVLEYDLHPKTHLEFLFACASNWGEISAREGAIHQPHHKNCLQSKAHFVRRSWNLSEKKVWSRLATQHLRETPDQATRGFGAWPWLFAHPLSPRMVMSSFLTPTDYVNPHCLCCISILDLY